MNEETSNATDMSGFDVPEVISYKSIQQRVWAFTQLFGGVEKGRTAKVKTRDGQYEYNYFNIDDIYEAAIPVMSECEIGVVSQIRQMPSQDGAIQEVLVTTLFCTDVPGDMMQNGPYSLESVIKLGGLSDRAYGSDLTYKRRYAIVTMLNIRVPGDDDDGFQAELERRSLEAGSAKGSDLLTKIKKMADEIEDGHSRVLEFIGKQYGVESVDELSLQQANAVQRVMRVQLDKQRKSAHD